MPATFEVGDFVQVKEWDEMEKEFGLEEAGRIHTPRLLFIRGMAHLCGQVFQIREFSDHNGMTVLRSVDNIEKKDYGAGFWYITPYMVKPAEDSGFEVELDLSSWQALIQS